MMSRFWGVLGLVALTVGVTWGAPPREGELDAYRADGSYQARADFMKEVASARERTNLIERARIKAQRSELVRQGFSSDDVNQMAPLPPPRWRGMPTVGNNKVLTILIEFDDERHTPANEREVVDDMLFGEGDPTNFPYESLKNYYQRSSFDKLTIEGDTLGWYRTAYPRSDVQQTTQGRENLIKEALEHYEAEGHDFEQYDNDGDGDIDYFIVIYAGPNNGWGNFWWAYQTGFNDRNYRIGGKSLGTYVFQFQNFDHTDPFDPVVVIHETGHALGLPDYYDYDNAVGPRGGVGGLDMMDGNRGDHNAFSKWVLDWSEPLVMGSGAYDVRLTPGGATGKSVAIMPDLTKDPFGEFFLVENRTRHGNDSANNWPGAGLLIWHVDATLNSSGNDYEYNNSTTARKLLRLMEADGLERIEGSAAWGDAAMFWTVGDEFDANTTPNTNAYDQSDTEIYVRNITINGDDFLATIGFEGAIVEPEPEDPGDGDGDGDGDEGGGGGGGGSVVSFHPGWSEYAYLYSYYSFVYTYYMVGLEDTSNYAVYGYTYAYWSFLYADLAHRYLGAYGRTPDYFLYYRYSQYIYSYQAFVYTYYAYAQTLGGYSYAGWYYAYYACIFGGLDYNVP